MPGHAQWARRDEQDLAQLAFWNPIKACKLFVVDKIKPFEKVRTSLLGGFTIEMA